MNTRPLSASLFAALAAAVVLATLPLRDAHAQNPTDTKIRLMAEALRARDAGDLAGAQKALAQLTALSPEDKAVQRLRAEIEAQATAQRAALEQRAASEQAAIAAARRVPANRAPEPTRAAVASAGKSPPFRGRDGGCSHS
jgi:general secretion pathway protein D